jgi:hypothetical protein
MRLQARFLGVSLVLAGAILAQDVKYNFDQDADFSKYKTYRWEQHPDSRQMDQLTLKQLGEAFDAELARKGLQKSTSGSSDLVIVYQLAVGQEKQITSFDSGFGTGPGYRRGWYGGGSTMTTSTTSTINIGSVALDMYDAAKKQLVWRGTATKTLDDGAKADKRQKNMSKAAEKMLKNYPPKAKG